MRRAAALLLACGCSAPIAQTPDAGPPAPVVRSVFELTAADFTQHRRWTADATGLHAQTGQPLYGSRSDALQSVWSATDTTLRKGEIVLLEAGGSIQSEGFTSGPDGQDAYIAGARYALPCRTLHALHGRVDEAEFVVGTSNALLAPDDGTLEIAVNGCTDCPIAGAFDLAVHTTLSDGVELATEPAITDNTIVEQTDVRVAASADWVSTGLTLRRGEKVFLDATGTLNGMGQAFDADGTTYLAGALSRLPSRWFGKLYARVGTRTVEAGRKAVFLSPADGPLRLAVNSDAQTTGTLTVRAARGVRPATGLESLAPQDLAHKATVQVRPEKGWTASGVTAVRGRPLVLRARGAVVSPDDPTPIDPWGRPGWLTGACYALPGRGLLALYARVGTSLFLAGESAVVLAPDDGPVELLVNGIGSCAPNPDSPCPAMCGATGQFEATVAAP